MCRAWTTVSGPSRRPDAPDQTPSRIFLGDMVAVGLTKMFDIEVIRPSRVHRSTGVVPDTEETWFLYLPLPTQGSGSER